MTNKALVSFRIDVMEADNGYIVELDMFGDHSQEPEIYRIGINLADVVHDAVGIALGYVPPETEQLTGTGVLGEDDCPF